MARNPQEAEAKAFEREKPYWDRVKALATIWERSIDLDIDQKYNRKAGTCETFIANLGPMAQDIMAELQKRYEGNWSVTAHPRTDLGGFRVLLEKRQAIS